MDESIKRPTPTKKTTDCRQKLIDAAVAETAEAGYATLSVERILRRAGTSRASFHTHFADEREAVEAAYQQLFERYFSRLLRACEAQPSWPLKVKVGIGATLDLAAAEPVNARFLAVDVLAADRELVLRVIESRNRLTRLLAPGRDGLPHADDLPAITEQVLVAGVIGVVSNRLLNGEAAHLPALAPPLVELTLTPYLGREAAAAVARRPRPGAEDH